MRRAITGFHRDSEGHWVAELACGHAQHTRHDPPFTSRPWVLSEAGRAARRGSELDCARCDRGEPSRIYHLAPLSELRRGIRAGRYAPDRLPADGFVHCAGSRDTALAVARDCFADPGEPLVCLELEVGLLSAPVRWEDPAPPPGAGTRHLTTARRFPHVYGPLDLRAVRAAGVLRRTAGGWAWPERLLALEELDRLEAPGA